MHKIELYDTTLRDGAQREGLSLSLTGETWDANEVLSSAMGFSIDYREKKKFDISGGYYFDLYKLDLYSDNEETSAGTYFLKYRHFLGDRTSLTGRLEYENTDIDGFFTFSIMVKQSF